MPHESRKLNQRRIKPTQRERSAAILSPAVAAAWRIRRRDPWRGDRILQSLHRALYILSGTPLPGEEPGANKPEKTKDPADNRDFQAGGEIITSYTLMIHRVTLSRNTPGAMAVMNDKRV